MRFTLRSGEQHVELPISYTPYYSLLELTEVACSALEPGWRSVARLNTEPEEFEFVVEQRATAGTVRVSLWSRRARNAPRELVLQHDDDARLFARTMWRALRRLETVFDEQQWHWPFPRDAMSCLDTLSASRGIRSR